MRYQKWHTKINLFLKGLLMGTANKIPGVSGGTVSFVFGFYEELVYSLQKINYKALKLLLNGRFKSLYQYLNVTFLLYLMGGSITSYFTVSLVLDYFLSRYKILVWSLFFGLIIGSIHYSCERFKNWTLQNIVFLLLGLFIGLMISFIVPTQENNNLLFIFFCGWIGVCGMTLPGLSGSFILMLLGNYTLLMVDTVNVASEGIVAVASGDFTFFDDSEHLYYLKILFSFVSGSLVGLISTAHLLTYLLKRWHDQVSSLIIGFISGSLVAVYPWKHIDDNYKFQLYIPDGKDLTTYQGILFILIGIATVWLVSYFEKIRSKKFSK